MPAVRPCLACGRPTRNGSRCPPCAQAREQKRDQQRGTRTQRGYGNEWHRRAKQAIAASPICVDCGHTGSPDNPLTGDHPVPLARGGEQLPAVIVVRCRVCNSRRGAGRVASTERPFWTPESRSPVFVRRSRSMEKLSRSVVVHLCGAPGSGKSWLGAELARILDMPALSIDDERVRLLRPGESWPDNDGLAWCALEDGIDRMGRALVETSGLHGNDTILFGGRRVLRLLCRAAPVVRQARLIDRVRQGYALIGDQSDYVARLLRIPEPTIPVHAIVETSDGVDPSRLEALASRVAAFLDGEGRPDR